MNKKRLSEINECMNILEGLKNDIEYCKVKLEELRDEEQDCYDNAPENLQYSERYEKIEENASNLDSIVDSVDNAVGELTDAIDGLQDLIDDNQ